MLRAKKIDAFGQVLLIAGFLLMSLIKQDESFIYGYFVVGSWQVLSMLIHIFYAKHMPLHVSRKHYQKLMLILLIALLIGLVTGFAIFLGLILIFTAPFIAAWYAWFSSRELQVWDAKNLIHLKN